MLSSRISIHGGSPSSLPVRAVGIYFNNHVRIICSVGLSVELVLRLVGTCSSPEPCDCGQEVLVFGQVFFHKRYVNEILCKEQHTTESLLVGAAWQFAQMHGWYGIHLCRVEGVI